MARLKSRNKARKMGKKKEIKKSRTEETEMARNKAWKKGRK